MNDDLVFYYCSISTALSILKNHEIWMTDIRNMNDGNETVGVYKMIFNLLEKYDEKKSLRTMFDFARSPGAIQLYETPLGAYPEYITCFSKDPDSVSQWVSYADNGQGIAIGFDEAVFTQLISDSSTSNALAYQDIQYVGEDELKDYIPTLYVYLLENLCDNELEMMDKAMEYIKQTYPSGIGLKTMHYASENEKRLIYRFPDRIEALSQGWNIGRINTYAKSNMINTYVPLSFPRKIIRKIVLGPKYQNNYFEAEIAMDALGYIGVEIRQSTSNYR